MSELLVQIMAGPRAGQVVRMRAGGVTFGRSAENAIHLPLPTISRTHATFELDGEQWTLANRSANGTRVNRRQVTDTPRRLAVGDRIFVGEDEVLRVLDPAVLAAEQPEATKAEQQPGSEAKPKLGRRGKLWAGIGIYMVLMLALFVFFSTLDGGERDRRVNVPRLSGQQIVEALRAPVEPVADNPRQYNASLEAARTHYALIDRDRAALYRSYARYREAMAHTRDEPALDAADLGRYQNVEDRLVAAVVEHYERGNALLSAGRYERAAEVFREVGQMYPDADSPLYQNVQQLTSAALRAARE